MRCANPSRNSGIDAILTLTESDPARRANLRRPSFTEVRAYLESGAPWPGQAPPECIETHSSVVFLTRDRAWKLKKPVRLIHVDQTTLASRESLCREEVRLNRDLSGDLYRGLSPLVQLADGTLALGGKGRIVDWLIEIVRLPAADMLDQRFAKGPLPNVAQIAKVSDVLAGFYRAQDPVPGAARTFVDRLLQDSRIAADHLREMAPKAGLHVPGAVLEFARPAIRQWQAEIMRRAERGCLIDGHGDLRAEHICLTDPPVIFDRLETDAGLRVVDPYFEVGALGIECELLGAGWVGPQLLEGLSSTFPPPAPGLLKTYGVVACLTRARLAIDHFRDAEIATPEKWRMRAEDYLRTAAHLADS